MKRKVEFAIYHRESHQVKRDVEDKLEKKTWSRVPTDWGVIAFPF